MVKYSIINVETEAKRGLRNMRQALNAKRGKKVNVYIEHKLFGKQHLVLDRFEPETEIGYGFHVGGQCIYIEKEDVLDWKVVHGTIMIQGKMMSIVID